MVVSDSSKRIDLTSDIWIERLDTDLAKNVQTACEPADFNFNKDPDDRHLYAFVSTIPDYEPSQYAGMTTLLGMIGLSRLVKPTSTGMRYCAMVWNSASPSPTIKAIQMWGVSLDVPVSTKEDWLTVQDGEVLKKLVPWLTEKMPDRVHRAYWNYDDAMRTYYLDRRLPSVVAGLEGLINTDRDENKKQFTKRSLQLANKLQVAISELELSTAWNLRSQLVHAQSFLFGLGNVLPQTEHSPLYQKLEELLRSSVRRCLLDDTFRAQFIDAPAVRSNFPK